MAIEDVLARISAIQARFGVGGVVGGSEFEGVLSDAARHAGIAPDERIDGSEIVEVDVADAGTGDTTSGTTVPDPSTSGSTADGSTTPGSDAQADTTPGSAAQADTTTRSGSAAQADTTTRSGSAPQADAAATETRTSEVVAVLDQLGVSTGGVSGEALEALSAATPALTTAAALGPTGSPSLLETFGGQLGAEEGTAMLASIIAQQQAGAGIIRATGS